MAVATRLKRTLLWLAALFGILLWLTALLRFGQVAENSDDFARIQNWLLLINSLGIGVLILLIVVNLANLFRDLRRHEPGSRLRARMVMLLMLLAVTPLAGVYLYSVQFINRGIDNWFNVDVERGLDNALELGQAALAIQSRDKVENVRRMAARLAYVGHDAMVGMLLEMRRESGALELTVYGANRQIVATSSESADVPRYPSDEIMLLLRASEPSSTIEVQPDDSYRIVATAPLRRMNTGELELLQAVFPVEQILSVLANQVQASHKQYAELSFMRTALKYSFTLTLSLVLAISLLAAVYGALYFARRLVVPIQQLMQGTRAVARGDFATRVPVRPAKDEIGFLVNSFNDMTQRLAKASEEARSSQQKLESERTKLEVILARLSTGVVSLEPDMRIRTANPAAGAILGVDLEQHVGQSLVELAESRPVLAQFLSVEVQHLEHGDTEWREQVVLRGQLGRRVLMCACTELPGVGGEPSGYVIVFDDITTLLQAQRDAAWGEVARRLAHEIKNPLTPIQLSAERLRRRYLNEESDRGELLDRATHTIIQQVESMKAMVNAFSEYARTPRMDVTCFDVNTLIAEVAELYAHQERPLSIKLELDPRLPPIEADAGRMRQMFHNLLRNALEAMENQDGRSVEIRTRRVAGDGADQVEIKVIDNGPGFEGEIVHQAFDPYVTSKPKGTGLGLAIVKKLVEEHGGHIGARNREQGGAEISILIPISSEAAESSVSRRQDHRRERA